MEKPSPAAPGKVAADQEPLTSHTVNFATDLTEADQLLDRTIQVKTPGTGMVVFGRYKLQRVLGRGGMGIVWLADDLKLERPVALKFLPSLIGLDPGAVKELKTETRRGLELSHPNIVRIYDFVDDDDAAAISMEFVDGKTLSELRAATDHGIFTVEQISRWLPGVCDALDYAHFQRKVVHRDLKPANIMLTTKDEVAKVADFGIARSLSDTMSRLSAAHIGTSGTLPYMSPQQAMGERPLPTDDVYSLGATIYELLAGKPPFYRGDLPTQINSKVPPPMAERRRELELSVADPIPKLWEEAIAACLHKDANMRPSCAGMLVEMLGLRPTTGTSRTMIYTQAGAAIPAKKRKSPVPLLAAAAAVAACVGSAAWYLTQQQQNTESPAVAATPPPAATEQTQPKAKAVQDPDAAQETAAPKRSKAGSAPTAGGTGVAAVTADPPPAPGRQDKTPPPPIVGNATAPTPAGLPTAPATPAPADAASTTTGASVAATGPVSDAAASPAVPGTSPSGILPNQTPPALATTPAGAVQATSPTGAAPLPPGAAQPSIDPAPGVVPLPGSIVTTAPPAAAAAAAVAPLPQAPPTLPPGIVPTQVIPTMPVQPVVSDPPSGFWTLDQLYPTPPFATYSAPGRKYLLYRTQAKLKERGLYTSSVDGKEGKSTHNAIQLFQAKSGLQPTGLLDIPTLSALQLAAEPDNMDWSGAASIPSAPSGRRSTGGGRYSKPPVEDDANFLERTSDRLKDLFGR